MIPVLFMLCSGFIHFTFVSSHLRFFNITASSDSWNNISKDCESRDESLLTVYDDEDFTLINNYLANLSVNLGNLNMVWIGLNKINHNASIWPEDFPPLKIDSLCDPDVPTCVGIHEGTLTLFNCMDKKKFMCYKDNNYTLIQETKDWCQAQLYCRTHFTDLVSISNKTFNQATKKGEGKTFWTGYMHDKWKWADNSCSTYRKWKPGCHQSNCAAFGMVLHGIITRPCTNFSKGICSKGKVRIKLIQENKTWEEAFRYCKENHTGLLQIKDADDQEAVKQWLTYSSAQGTFWIGLRQSRTFGFWIWRDWTVSYNQWKNNTQPEMPLSNNCGVISKKDYKWSDEECSLKHYFLCEENISFMRQ